MPPEQVAYAIALAIKSVADLLQTPAGQKQLEVWVNDQIRMRQDFEALAAWFKAQFNKK